MYVLYSGSRSLFVQWMDGESDGGKGRPGQDQEAVQIVTARESLSVQGKRGRWLY